MPVIFKEMTKKKVTLNIDSKVYDSFKDYCERNAIVLSKKIEIVMLELLRTTRKVKFATILFILAFSFVAANIFQDNNQTTFDSGAYNGTFYNPIFSAVQLNLSGGFLNGTYTSQIFDAGRNATWKNISWMPEICYGCALPNNSIFEVGEFLRPANMSGNVLLAHFNEITGATNFADSSGNGNNGVCVGVNCPVAGVGGKFNASTDFETSTTNDDYINFSNPAQLNSYGNKLSMEAWIKLESIPTDPTIIDKSLSQFSLFIDSPTNRLVVYVVAGSSQTVTGNVLFVTDVWYHVAAVYNGSDIRLYTNGILDGTPVGLTGNVVTTNRALLVGSGWSGSNPLAFPFDGIIDEVAIYNRSLSAQEIKEHYLRGILELNLSVQSCDDSLCSGESFVELNRTSPQSLLDFNYTRYFQYRFNFRTENITYTPYVFNATIDYTPIFNVAPTIHSNYTLVNGSVAIPVFGESFFVQTNISDHENDSVSVGFTIIAPNGTRVLDNVLGINYSVGTYSIWNSTNYTINDYGYWNWSLLASDGTNFSQQNGSFRVLSDLSIFPVEYIVTPNPKNQTLSWNLSMYHNSLEDYNFTFSYNLNSTFFNLSFTNSSVVMSKAVYNDTNLFKNQIIITTVSTITENIVYEGNITIQRDLDGKNYTVPLKIGINPPSGNADALDTPYLSICQAGSCDVDTTMQNDEIKSFAWAIKNTGSFALTNCQPAISGFDISEFGSFNLNNFNIAVGQNIALTLTISQPAINSYYGKLNVICQATVLGFNDSLGADSENVPSLRLVVTADSGSVSSGGGGGGGGSSSGGITATVIKDIFELGADSLEKLEIGRGESESIALKVKNLGNKFLNGCFLSATNGVYPWISTSQIESLSPGQEIDYVFTINVPIDAERGEYSTNLNINCKEASLTQEYSLSVIGGDFELTLLSSEKVGTKLKVTYAIENFGEEEKEILIHYQLVNSKKDAVAEGNIENVRVPARERVENSFEFELPKNSIGDYTILVDVNDGVDTNKYEQELKLSAKGVTGLAISDTNLKTISWFGILVLISFGIYLVIKMIRRQLVLRREGQSVERQFIKIDMED